MIIKRDKYMKFLNEFKDNDAIKVITGIRRSGKTFLMNMFIDQLKDEGIQDDQIIHINFEDLAFNDLKNQMDLYKFVHEHENKEKRIIFSLMKFRMCKIGKKQLTVFEQIWMLTFILLVPTLTCLSGEMATLLSGRYVELKVYPLSFKEYYDQFYVIQLFARILEMTRQLLQQSYLFYEAKKYSIRGKKLLSTLGKYYVADTGLRNIRLNKNYRDNLGHQIENIVFIELLRRGYNVDVGDYSGKEIDFVARKGNEIKYYQVTEHLPEGSTRETDNLRYIPDGYQKTVLSLSQFDEGTVDGIAVKYLIDWLSEEQIKR